MIKPLVKILATMASLFVLGVAVVAPASADVTLKMHMSMDNPMMRNMTPEMKTMMDKYMNMTEYYGLKKVRVDSFMVSIITDLSAKQMIMANNMNRKYAVTPLDEAKVKAMMNGNGKSMGMPSVDKTDQKIVDTGNTRTILGHKCHEYIVTTTINTQGQVMTTNSDIFSATDLGMDNPYADAQGDLKVSGIPLLIKTSITGGMGAGTTVTLEATDVSTDSIPASTFQAPDGYTLTDQANLFGGMGGMMNPPMH